MWEATKGFINDFSITFSTNLKKMQNQRIDYFEKHQSLECSLKSLSSNLLSKILQTLIAKLNDLRERKQNFNFRELDRTITSLVLDLANF